MDRSPLRSLAALLLLALAALVAAPAFAQGRVVRDATLGSGRNAAVGSGLDTNGGFANYLITPDLGETHDANLFHSFAFFDVGANETATFTGPASIDHVIARVTGGSASQIDGMLRSVVPSADLYLINPSGVMFGAGAQLDVDGSFHATTAD